MSWRPPSVLRRAWYHARSLQTVSANSLLAPDPPGRWRALAVLAGSSVLSMGAWFSASAVLPQLRTQWHLSSGTGSLMTISVQLGFVAGCLGSAILNLADLVRPRR